MRAIHPPTQLGNPFLSVIMGLVGGGQQGAGKATDSFLAAQNQIQAEELAALRARKWNLFANLAIGAAAVVGTVYLLKRSR